MAMSHAASFAVVLFKCARAVRTAFEARGAAALPAPEGALPVASVVFFVKLWHSKISFRRVCPC